MGRGLIRLEEADAPGEVPGASPDLGEAPTRPRWRVRRFWMLLPQLEAVQRYAGVISCLGLALVLTLVVTQGVSPPDHRRASFWLLVLFAQISELVPIMVPRRSDVEEITTSTTFAFALMLGWGTAPAVYVLAAVAVISDVLHRKPLPKVLFNFGQYALTMGAAGALYAALGGGHSFSSRDLGPMIPAALTFFLVNNVLTGIAVSLAQGMPILGHLRRELVFNAAVAAALLAMSPVVIIVADRSLALAPLLALPVAAVHLAARSSIENMRLVASLESSLARLTELNRVKDEFVAVVSHELRTPLTSIRGYVKSLLQLDLEEEERRSFLEGADRQAERLQLLIEQLLVLSRLEARTEQVLLTPVSVGSVIADVVDEFRASPAGHKVHVRSAEGLGPVPTDRQKVSQILSNLIENALKYSPPHSKVVVRGRAERAGIVISVEDQGPGIPPECQERIFERFYQVDQTLTRTVGGTGLGLYICRRLGEEIGATVWLRRSDSSGSVFCLTLPWVAKTHGIGDPDGASDGAAREAAAVAPAIGPVGTATPSQMEQSLNPGAL